MITEKEIELKLEEYKGLIISTTNRFSIYGMDFDDIYQELCMEFVKVLKAHDENGGANIKTLFITYANNWFKVKMRKQSYQKRGIPLRLEIDELENSDKIEAIKSPEPSPDILESQERLVEDIMSFLTSHKWGQIFLDIEENGKTLRELATGTGLTFQAIGKRYKRVREDLIKHLKERGYNL